MPEPFTYIGKAYGALRPGGVITFLATPNANSLVYKLFNTLPALDPQYNFYIPSDVSLGNILRNYGFRVAAIEFPYLHSPYARPVTDHLKFSLSVLVRRPPKFAFWRNMMNVVAYKD